MDDAELDRLFSGDIINLTPLPKRVVRLFISSTFTDMTLERNSLMERVYPRLKKFCRERYGLDFQVVDMRWGVRDEATDDHQTATLCSREIDNCQRMSLGPNFVALLGDKYGFRPLCNRIKSSEYRALRRCLIELDINTDFLDTWYKEDLNAVPAEYLLQPISSILKNFTNRNEPELQSVDQRIWLAIQERLHELLLIGSERLVQQGRMSRADQLMRYSISVTEREVIEGCLDVKDAKSHCLVYVRTITDVRAHIDKCLASLANLSNQISAVSECQSGSGSPASSKLDSNGTNQKPGERKDSSARKASLQIGDDSICLTTGNVQNAAQRRLDKTRKLLSRYVDLVSRDSQWLVDEEAQNALHYLKEKKLEAKLRGRSLTKFQVQWHEHDGISVKSDEHKHYLAELTEHFYANLTRMIRKAAKSEQQLKSGLIGEVLQHSHYARHVSKSFYGRDAELELIKSYVTQRTKQTSSSSFAGHAPMFVYGVGGAGKTSIMARAATLVNEWTLNTTKGMAAAATALALGSQDNRERWDTKPCIIMRFCCTTPSSSSMVGVLSSVCRQLQFNFYQYGPMNGVLERVDANMAKAHGADAQQDDVPQLAHQPVPEDFVRLVFMLRQLLDNCRHRYHRRRLFVIILDSIERLSMPSDCNVEVKYSWLTSIARLPPNVRLIVSCSSECRSSVDEAWTRDYRHLKRHFLQLYFDAWLRTRHSTCDNQDSAVAERAVAPQRLADLCALDSGPTSTAAPFGDDAFADNNATDEDKFHVLRRLIMPAIRLLRNNNNKTQPIGDVPAHSSSFESPFFSPIEEARRRQSTSLDMRRLSVVADQLGHSASQRNSDAEDSTSTLSSSSSSMGHEDDEDRLAARAVPNRVYMLHIKPMGTQLALSVVQRWLSEVGRGLTQPQWSIVEKSFSHCSRPIFAKLAFGELVNWKSYSMQGDTRGLTFGSSLLEDYGDDNSNGRHCNLLSGDPLIDEAVRELSAHNSNSSDSNEFRWQVLSVEQQWNNYMEYVQRKEEQERRFIAVEQSGAGSAAAGAAGGALVIRLGAAGAGDSSAGDAFKTTTTSSSGGVSSVSVCHLSNTIDDAICQLFARIELQHGYVLTKHSLSYITAARNGICENELEDILSLDDVVLDDVFQYHLPPVRRIPPLLWTRIRNDLPDYLSERDADGIVVNWHHSQFKHVTQMRYLSDKQQLIYIHSMLADYFLGKWADKPKPFRCTKQQIQMAAEQLESAVQQSLRDSQQINARPNQRPSISGASRLGNSGSGGARSGASFSVRSRLRSSDQHDQRLQWMQARADRRVAQQPLYYTTTSTSSVGSLDTSVNAAETPAGAAKDVPVDVAAAAVAAAPEGVSVRRRYNMRKLTELPYHLMRSGRFADLANEVLFNYKWLFAAVDATGLQNVLADFDEARDALESAITETEALESDVGARLNTANYYYDQIEGLRNASSAGANSAALSEELTAKEMRAMLEQLNVLSDTIRLSCSSIHSDPQMLGPQIIGRLLPFVVTDKRHSSVKYLNQLLEQCDKFGSLDCALLPTGHCLQSPDGLQLSSLEGHSFAITCMAMATDKRHLLAASNRFVMWDTSTGEISRDIDARIEGAIVQQLRMGANNEYAVAYTSNNELLLVDILTQQVSKFSGLRCEQSRLIGIDLIEQVSAMRFVVWTRHKWFVVQARKSDSSSSSSNGSVCMDIAAEVNLCQELNTSGLTILRVRQRAISSHCSDEICVVDCAHGNKSLKLVTCKMSRRRNSAPSLTVWPQIIECASLAVSDDLRQLVFASPASGELYLSRRRAQHWSRAKLLRGVGARDDNAGDSDTALLAERLNAMASRDDDDNVLIEREPRALPLAIELDTPQCAGGIELGRISRERTLALAEFERDVDAQQQQTEINENCVFERATALVDRKHAVDANGPANDDDDERGARPLRTSAVRLYMNNRIVVVRLAPARAECVCHLPRGLRNISVELNRCQVNSLRVASHATQEYLVAACGRKLLFYALFYGAQAQLVRSIDAHGARIVQLLAIPSARQQTKARGEHSNSVKNKQQQQQQQLCIASASMDKSVKIWNLDNLNKDMHTVCRLQNGIESMSVASQRPLCACLARGELGVWDWRTLRILIRLQPADLAQILLAEQQARPRQAAAAAAAATQGSQLATRITKCRLSVSGRFLALATVESISVVSLDDAGKSETEQPMSRWQPGRSLCCRCVFTRKLPERGAVRRLRFFAQDSRLLSVLECARDTYTVAARAQRPDSGASLSAASSSTTTATTTTESMRVSRSLVLMCHSVPDGRLVWRAHSLAPCLQQQQHQQQPQSHLKADNDETDAAPDAHSAAQVSLQSGASMRASAVRLPVMTRDELHVVCAELFEASSVDQPMPIVQPQQQQAAGTSFATRARRRLSAIGRCPMALIVRSARDGQLLRAINLSQLELYDVPPPPPPAANNMQQQAAVIDSKLASQRMPVSIASDQFTRLKPVVFRERTSAVALLGDERGSSYLIDVQNKQLLACSSLWNGRVSSDGRYGLSRMFKSSSSSTSTAQHSSTAATSSSAAALLQSSAAFVTGGLQLLEMRRVTPLKTLLSADQLCALTSGGNEAIAASARLGNQQQASKAAAAGNRGTQITTSDSDVTCGFSRTNDAYVYYYDSRIKRLLLIRVRDSQLIANYKLSVPIAKIRCSPDGYALILALADGSLTTLAIVEPQSNDSLVRLSQYPSRKRA